MVVAAFFFKNYFWLFKFFWGSVVFHLWEMMGCDLGEAGRLRGHAGAVLKNPKPS